MKEYIQLQKVKQLRLQINKYNVEIRIDDVTYLLLASAISKNLSFVAFPEIYTVIKEVPCQIHTHRDKYTHANHALPVI